MECLYKEVEDKMFPLDEPCEEMGSEAFEVPALRDEEFAQIIVLGLCVFFPNGHNRVIHIRGVLLAESSQSSESSIGRHIREPIWYLDSGCSRSKTGVKSYLYGYVEQPGPKVVFGDNSSCITEGYGSINCGGIVFTKVAFVNGLKYNLISISQLCDAKYIEIYHMCGKLKGEVE
ncbi:hypothetical protein Tco_1270149 [Tanacetum coccineum]